MAMDENLGMRTSAGPVAIAAARPAKSARHEALLEGLEGILLREGFRNQTTDDFAAELHCSKSTLYRLAPGKDQLVVAAARHFFARATTVIEAAVAEAETPSEKVAMYLTSVGREMCRGSQAFHEQMASEPLTAELYLSNANAAAERVRQLIHEGVRDGAFHVTDAEFAGQIVAVVLHWIHVEGLTSRSGDAAADAHRKLSALLLHGLVGADGSAEKASVDGAQPAGEASSPPSR
jgi:AcrR family transcriptional regulator